eukprot:9496275-Pyramimonas_sp.AAC.1
MMRSRRGLRVRMRGEPSCAAQGRARATLRCALWFFHAFANRVAISWIQRTKFYLGLPLLIFMLASLTHA